MVPIGCLNKISSSLGLQCLFSFILLHILQVYSLSTVSHTHRLVAVHSCPVLGTSGYMTANIALKYVDKCTCCLAGGHCIGLCLHGAVKVRAAGPHDTTEPKLQQAGRLYCKGSTVMTANTKGQYLKNTHDILSLNISGATALFI